MKKINIILGILIMMSLMISQAMAQPKALIENSVFAFAPIPEGLHITHEFKVKNIGDSLLHITNVKPPWGCDKHSFDKEIPPGGEGKISLSFKTAGYGGRTMKKVTLVKTDDPAKPSFSVTITGPVDKIITIDPRSVFLEGKPGDNLESVIKITPIEKYRCSIIGLEQKKNSEIKATLIAPEGDSKFWQIKVKATSSKAGQFYDQLILKTDSKYMPSISIRAYAIFSDK